MSGFLSKQKCNDSIIGIGENIIHGQVSDAKEYSKYHAVNFYLMDGVWWASEGGSNSISIDLSKNSTEEREFLESYKEFRLFQIEEMETTTNEEQEVHRNTSLSAKDFIQLL